MQTIALKLTSTTTKPLVKRAISAAFRFFELRRQRRQLSELSPEMLRDIGLSNQEVAAELQRPVWDAPSQFLIK